MRSPEGDDPPPSLVTDPPADPPPADPSADPPPADPPADPPKPADPPADSPAPLTVESLTLPEGFELQPEMASEFLEILNGDQSPQDRANALIALHGKTLTEASEASSKLWEEMQTKWKDEVRADPDIGGAKLQPAITNIQKLIDEYGTSDLKDVFALTGAGNNIHIIKFLDKVANVLTEGKLFTAGSPAGANDPDAVAKRMFPSMKG